MLQKSYFFEFCAKKLIKPMGRICNQVSQYVRGKHKPVYKRGKRDLGDPCIIVNAGDILLTGKKARKKRLIYHTGFVGHLKSIPYNTLL